MNFITLSRKLFTMVYTKLLSLCIMLFASTALFGQAPPANDNACQATVLTPDATCTYVQGTNLNATNSSGVAAPTCGSYNGGDVWFKVTVPAGGAISFDMQGGTMTDGALAVYRGNNCIALTAVVAGCDDNSSSNPNMPKVTVTGLTPGSSVYARVWSVNNASNGTFGICATIPVPAPTNDEVCNAIQLTPTETCTYQTFTNESASNTSSVPAPVCAGFLGGDVWFKVVVPTGTTALVFDSQEGSMTDGAMSIYSGSACTGTLTQINCDDNSSVNGDMPSMLIGGLTPGDTVWIRFWENGNNNNGTFGICVTLPPPPPSNDDPCTAREIIVGTTCTYEPFTNQDATGSSGITAPGCAGYNGGDVWFKVVVPAGGAIAFDSQEGTMTDGGMAIYSGNCASLTLIDCDDDASVNGNMPALTLGGLTPGDTVWVRFWENGNDENGTFGICATLPPPPPANDDPCTAIELIAEASCTYQTFTNESSTGTSSVPDPGCAGYQGSDIWFKVVVPAGGALNFDSQTGSMLDGGMAVYSGPTCDNLTLIDCDDDASNNGNMPKLTIGGLTPGDTVWVRFWEFFNDNNGTFGICVSIPPPPPANDEPCNSVELPVGATCTYQTFTNESATGSSSVPDPGCAGYQGGDVWFKAVVPAGGAIAFDTQDDVMTDGGMAVYSGTCDNLTLLACDDNGSANGAMPKLTVGGLTEGDTVWVRVWENGNDNNGTFGICATIPPPPPTNDDPCNAIVLTPDSVCNFQTFTNENATATPGVPAPGCAGYQGSDVWFSVVVPSGGALIFDSNEGVITDGGMAIYSGTCGNLTLIDCDDDGSLNGNMSLITAGGLTPGDTIWVRFWEFFNDNNGSFDICVRMPPPGPVNDDPCGATELPVETTCNYQTFTNESSFGSAGAPAPGCANYQGSDVWFKVIVPAEGALTFDTQAGVVTDGGMAVYTGTCNNLTLAECDDDDGAGNMPKMTLGGLTPGDTVWIRFWENGNTNNGTFGICVTIPPPPPGNDNPCGAISITATDSCSYQTFSNEGSYGTASVPDPGCGNYQGADVWFQVTAPAGGALNINTQGITIVDAAMAIYKADSCNGTMTLLYCDDNASSNQDMPYITATGITPGSTLWIRVWSNGGAISAGTFGICATIPSLQPATFSFSCARDTSFTCGGGDSCFTLEAIIPDIHALTDRYAVNPLSAAGCFNPYVDPGNEGPSADLTIDDTYSEVINLPFTFPFFGTNYNSLIASTNGYVSFDITQATNFSHWDITDGTGPRNLPAADGYYDRALIMGPYHDLDPAYNTSPTMRIKYNITGTIPHRRWVFSFYKVPLFQAGQCDTLIQNTHQIVLYEGTGVVEVFIFDMQNCLTWNEGRAMVGMQDFNMTRGIMAPGRAATDNPWGRIGLNESWRFVPIGGPTLFKRVELFDTSGNFLATGDTSFLDSASLKVNFTNLCALNRLPAGVNTLIVRAVYQKFNDPTQEEIGADTVRIFIPNLKVNFDVTNGQCSTPGSVSIHLLNGVQPLRFSSDSGRTWQSDSVFTNLATGVYYFKVQDGAGCARDTIINITALNGLDASFAVTNAACNGDSGTVIISTGGTRPIRYSSDGGATFQYGDSTFTLPAGTYNFRVIDTTGCSKDSTITITEPLALAAQYADSAVHCNGGSDGTISVVSVSGGTGPFTYSFDNAGYTADSSLSTFAAGPHTVSIKDAIGCTKDTTIIIIQPGPFLALYAGNAVLCNGGSNGIISVTFVSGGVGPYTYSFDNAGYATDSTKSTFAAGPHTVSIKDANGCTKDTTITVAEPASFFALYADSSVHCNGGSDGIISVTFVSGGVGPFTYSFDNATYGPDSTKSTFTAGPHTVSIKDANGCTKDTTITVTQPALITALYTVHDAKCFGGNDGSIVITASGGTPGYEYSVGNGYQASDSFPLAAGTYTVRIRDANGCTKDTSIIVGQPTAITATYAVTNVKCFAANSGSIIISASGGTPGYEYSINGGNSYQADDSFAVVANTYVVRIRDANGCTKDTTIIVTQPEVLAASASAGSTGCNTTTPTGQIIVTATGGTPGAGGYQYSNGGSFQSSNTFAGLTQNNFTITVKDANGCTVTTAVTVGVANDLRLQTRQDTTICGPVSVVLYTTSNAQTIGWTGASLSNPSVLSPTASPTVIGTAEYIVTAQTGTCILRDTVNIIVTPAPSVDAGNGISVIKGLDAQLNGTVSNAASFAWTPTTYLNNASTLTPTAVMPQQTITYTLTATNAEGCSNSDTVTVTVLPYCIKVKNAFSPNGDGVNDNWMVYDQYDCLQNIKVQVFNRYGSRVFESKNYRNDWKGTYGGNNLPDATYYYVIDYILLDGRDYQVRGDVTILR